MLTNAIHIHSLGMLISSASHSNQRPLPCHRSDATYHVMDVFHTLDCLHLSDCLDLDGHSFCALIAIHLRPQAQVLSSSFKLLAQPHSKYVVLSCSIFILLLAYLNRRSCIQKNVDDLQFPGQFAIRPSHFLRRPLSLQVVHSQRVRHYRQRYQP